jgi:antitoxin component YwqK of YwqJK toxin-antitoxin module/predicted MPP superfamily phosphohydrolase
MRNFLTSKAFKYFLSAFIILFGGYFIKPLQVFSNTELDSNVAPFTIVLLPDTQFYNEHFGGSRRYIFDFQTQWIASHKNDMNIVLALHLGDIIDYGTETQLRNAKESLSYLEGIIPYIVTIGNHDILWTSFPRRHRFNKPNSRGLFHQFFPLSLYENMSSFGGVLKNDAIENSFHFFEFGKIKYMVVTLEHRPNDEVLKWANQITAQYPGKQVIVLTHEYLENNDTVVVPYGVDIWEKYVRKHQNIRFVFSGHVKGPGKLISRGDKGNPIFQIGSNYQFEDNGGGGYLRLLKFYPEEKKIVVKTFSPILNKYKTDKTNQFVIDLKKSIFSYDELDGEIKNTHGRIVKRRENGKLSVEWNYKEGKLEGETKLFYPDERVKAIINYSNGLPKKVLSYYQNGQLNFSGNFFNGQLGGEAKRFYGNGQLMYSKKLINSKFEGPRSFFYPNGNLKEEKKFKNSMVDGEVKLYYSSGALREVFTQINECEFEYCKGLIDGLWKEYYENGTPKSVTTYVVGYEDGPAKFYHENGSLKKEVTYYRNKSHGVVKEYFSNGKLKYIGHADMGKRSGLTKFFSEEGVLTAERNYLNNKPHGIFKKYYPNGNIKSVQNLELGLIDGAAILFSTDGGIGNIFYFESNKLNGVSYEFNPPSSVLQVEWNYVNGKREGLSTMYGPKGGETKLSYSNDKLNGLVEQFDANGKLLARNRFKDDHLIEILPVN